MALQSPATVPPSQPRLVAKSDVDKLLDAMVPLLALGKSNALSSFNVPVGPATTATVSFSGPVDKAVIDALIEQLNLTAKFAATEKRPATDKAVREMLDEAVTKILAARS